ncbi:acyl-CoA synthetase (AMP-forming)/AMP-acid ligase II [Kibdelosporangium banguiense]|uniref:Acyl-CoA synthetase (AMP-forming)/AMP-acid ligase II n=1 Tax=Kibdelosporangium banguiense TaxID=1365924 RepID=A0ABS4TPW5_9PSEU|nr:AMP-binding protein [Kibdelosporangium banguiense]MBP2326447.1 acyl-CoA synthetase (AMP-forming)/AMP-acid ligase II [Kibdelosporangium banguiense]
MIYTSPVPDVHIPDVSLSDHVLAECARRPHGAALIDGVTGEVLTYSALDSGSRRAALGLLDVTAPGDVVALISHNEPAYAVALHAALRAGLPVAPINPRLTVDNLIRQLRTAGARVIITSVQAADNAIEAARRVGVDLVYVMGEADWCRPFGELLATQDSSLDVGIEPSTAVAILPHTTGAGGGSKCAVLTHRNLVANLQQHQAVAPVTEFDVFCASVPFCHMYGTTLVLNCGLLGGATVITLPRFELNRYLDVIQRYGVTRGHLAPPILVALANSTEMEHYDLSSVRQATSAAAPIDPDVVRVVEERLGCPIRQGYGATEASPATHVAFDNEFMTVPAGAVGRPLPNTACRIVDLRTGADADAGELWVRGPQVMRGYLGEHALADGWFRTGDLVRVDAQGMFWIVGRLAGPAEYADDRARLTGLLRAHPRVVDATVIGMPGSGGEQLPHALVVANGGVDARCLLDWIRRQGARLCSVEFVDWLPGRVAMKSVAT